METRIDRRQLLKAGAAATVVGGTQLFTGIPALADYAAAPAVRRNASTMTASDPILRGYTRAIRAMRALPDTNPCSWFYQAAIHGTYDPRNLPSWNTCHLDSNFFWAWHRMYLYWFERIVRKQSGMYDWAIPYWDWTNPGERALPPAFRNASSLLYDGSRYASINSGTPLSSGLATSVANAMIQTNYFTSQNGVSGPHGTVHISVGGNMVDVHTAAQDPIFWAHHSFVDRLWNAWLAQGGGRTSPVGAATWRNSTYTFFDECCQPVTMKGCDVLRAALQLSYVYEGEPPQVNQYCPRIWVFDHIDIAVLARTRAALVLGARPVRVPLPVADADAAKRLRQAATGERALVLRLAGIEADSQPGVSWEVHVGPKGFAPSPRSLVGMFALFGAGLKDRPQHFHPAEFDFALGRAAAGIDPSALEVVLVPVSGLESRERVEAVQPRVPVRIGEIDLVLDAPLPMPPRDEQEKLRREEASQ